MLIPAIQIQKSSRSRFPWPNQEALVNLPLEGLGG